MQEVVSTQRELKVERSVRCPLTENFHNVSLCESCTEYRGTIEDTVYCNFDFGALAQALRTVDVNRLIKFIFRI